MKRPLLLAFAVALLALPSRAATPAADAELGVEAGRTMALTFDDLPAQRIRGLPTERIEHITRALASLIRERELPAIGFVNEQKLEIGGEVSAERVALLETWLEAGTELGNHTYSHPNLHAVPLAGYLADIDRGERLLRPMLARRGAEPRYFRHPFLRTGRDLPTRDAVVKHLEGRGYRVAPVTIDNSEWIFARAYDEALDRQSAAGPPATASELAGRVGKAYVDYMLAMTAFYEDQSHQLFGREIPQTLLLHANALNADHLPALLDRLEERGYSFVDLDTALEDPAYRSRDTYTGPAGITWLHRWALTRKVDPSMFRGEPTTPEWIQELAGIRE